ncbi:hypothetical protein [Thalassobellus sediminis]|uniref:hypothetical protein n=1 Tax=Thalassobellus sediminis TaxID=3367753 RepID=UPI00379C9D60
MFIDTTYTNDNDKMLITDLVGKPYSFIKSFKMKGVGSKRMIIEDVSLNLKQYMNSISDPNYANIELRESGIIVYINKGLKNFSWVIPYYQLVLYKSNSLSIHANGRFIRFKNNQMLKENKKFFSKMINQKIKYNNKYKFQDS